MDLSDQRQLDAAEGWLGLGDWKQANEELEQITPRMRAHPLVLHVRWGIYEKAKKWDAALEVARMVAKDQPTDSWGWIHWAYTLHEMKRTAEARDVLLSVVDRFPKESTISYNLACYFCQLDELSKSREWLNRAFEFEEKDDLRSMALNDPDLKPLWKEIQKKL